MNERTTGYSLLILGIIIMIFAAFQIISVFTGKAKPIELFQMEEKTTLVQTNESNSVLDQIQNSALGKNIDSGKLPNVQLIDPGTLDSILNLTVYYLIMQFLLNVGFKLANLGTQLVRPIIVKMNHRTLQNNQNQDD